MTPNHPNSGLRSVEGDVSTLLAFIFEQFGKPGHAGALPDAVVQAARRLEADIAAGGVLRAGAAAPDCLPDAPAEYGVVPDHQLLELGAAHGRPSVSMLPYARAIARGAVDAIVDKLRPVLEVHVAWEIPNQHLGPELTAHQARANEARRLGLPVEGLVRSSTINQIVSRAMSTCTPEGDVSRE